MAGRYAFGRGCPELQCQRIKRDGAQCQRVRVTGSRFCCVHGGGDAGRKARLIWRQWRKASVALYSQGYQDELAALVPCAGRIVLGEAWLAAREHGDPRLYQQARRTVAGRYRARLIALGRADVLEGLGIASGA